MIGKEFWLYAFWTAERMGNMYLALERKKRYEEK